MLWWLARSRSVIVLISVGTLISCDGLGRAERAKELREMSSKLDVNRTRFLGTRSWLG